MEHYKKEEMETEEESEESQREKDKKSNRNLMIFFIAVFLMIALILSIRFFMPVNKIYTLDEMFEKTLGGETSATNYLYNGYVFVEFDGIWFTELQNENNIFDIQFRFGPKQLENVSIEGQLKKNIQDYNQSYITFDPTYSNRFQYINIAAIEISKKLIQTLGVVPIAACTRNETEACSTRPILNCGDGDYPIIYLKESSSTGVYIKDNCIILQGSDMEIVRAADRWLYQQYGIMK